ncbi:MAG: excinuclease ABC subunit C [Candidatus Moranbacteria bacterium CG10_big_fil_rev_8_21_14_0_10_35_21]|nr:MAG: excinuclease ABC subunit C [Candidatus Moranbacteria bacterium CG10_big_fil_rev_8_21_14_0_10_35_21]PJA88438.1 MAG: excinuclease ABC subunit C [Candidatus Moranbacteria bacterium CG_4_9_14_3_um_filter_36_9]
MFYVYIIKNEQNDIYYGYTNNLRRKIKEHNDSKSFSTKGHRWNIIYYEAYLSKSDAEDREKQIKHYGQALVHLKRRIKNSLSKN